jgi:hypothetical protein
MAPSYSQKQPPRKTKKRRWSIVRKLTPKAAGPAAAAAAAVAAVVEVASNSRKASISYHIPHIDEASHDARRPVQQCAHGPHISMTGGVEQHLHRERGKGHGA